MNESQNNGLLIHVGFHKTASKWLQRTVFCSTALGFYSPWKPGSGEVYDVLVRPDAGQFDPQLVQSVFTPAMSKAHESGLLPVISNEDLCGYPVQGKYYGLEIANRIHQAFPNARILIGIREQKSMLFSMYQQYIRQYGSFRLDKYFGVQSDTSESKPLFKFEHLEYHVLVSAYQRLFGKDNVLVMPLELLRRDDSEYLAYLSGFLGFQVVLPAQSRVLNAGWSGLTLALRRRINAILPRPQFGQGPGFGHRSANHFCYGLERVAPNWANQFIENKWKDVILHLVDNRYGNSNSELETMTGLNLAQYDYDVNKK